MTLPELFTQFLAAEFPSDSKQAKDLRQDILQGFNIITEPNTSYQMSLLLNQYIHNLNLFSWLQQPNNTLFGTIKQQFQRLLKSCIELSTPPFNETLTQAKTSREVYKAMVNELRRKPKFQPYVAPSPHKPSQPGLTINTAQTNAPGPTTNESTDFTAALQLWRADRGTH